MIVKVIIQRDVTKGLEKNFFSQLKELRFNAMNQNGYITGETLICAENTNKVVVISQWETLEDWNAWKHNEQRLEIDARLNEFQDNQTVYEPFVFSRYKAAAEQGFPPTLQDQKL